MQKNTFFFTKKTHFFLIFFLNVEPKTTYTISMWRIAREKKEKDFKGGKVSRSGIKTIIRKICQKSTFYAMNVNIYPFQIKMNLATNTNKYANP